MHPCICFTLSVSPSVSLFTLRAELNGLREELTAEHQVEKQVALTQISQQRDLEMMAARESWQRKVEDLLEQVTEGHRGDILSFIPVVHILEMYSRYTCFQDSCYQNCNKTNICKKKKNKKCNKLRMDCSCFQVSCSSHIAKQLYSRNKQNCAKQTM